MMKGKHIAMGALSGLLFTTGCDTGKGDKTTTTTVTTTAKDTTMVTRKVSMVISAIPFPSGILDTLHSVHAAFQSGLANPVDNMNLYSESNTQSMNLGIYGADLAYVISFEQFQEVGKYMKSTKFLSDAIGIPMAFTQDVIERCQKNQNNKDSLNNIVFESYYTIDNTLKTNKRTSSEVLVLAGGWLEGLYLTTQGLSSVGAPEDRKVVFHVLIEQKGYLDKILNLLDVISDSPYCQQISTSLHDIRGAFNPIADAAKVSEGDLKTLTDKVMELRNKVIKGGKA
jgi:hypothetical protein